MKSRVLTILMGVLVTLATGAPPAAAQVQAHKNEIHLYVGEMFGDDLTDRPISGTTPKLDDDVTYGVRYGRDFTETWGLEVSVGRSPNSATDAPGGDIDLDVTTLDVDAVWHFTPRARVVGYLVGGAGYAAASLDQRIRGTVNGQPVSIGDDRGFTLNAGVGAKFFATRSLLIRAEARYRYLDKLVDRFDTSLSTVETTAGVGWLF